MKMHSESVQLLDDSSWCRWEEAMFLQWVPWTSHTSLCAPFPLQSKSCVMITDSRNACIAAVPQNGRKEGRAPLLHATCRSWLKTLQLINVR